MEQEKLEVIELCKTFAEKADELENRHSMTELIKKVVLSKTSMLYLTNTVMENRTEQFQD